MLYTGWWPTFNVADVAIVCGAFALAATAWRAPPEPATVP
jgi:signal peptidase II